MNDEKKPNSESDETRVQRIVALATKRKSQISGDWTAESLYQHLDEAIIGNERYKRALAICLADYLGPQSIRNHLLVAGPSGTGKTYLLEVCLPQFGLPYHVIDASSLVPAGYKGNTLQETLLSFFRLNPAAVNKCIIVLDEFDKISERANGGDTFKSQSLQSELLTLIQGRDENGVDTRRCLWITLGAFAYTDEMHASVPKISKNDLLKYGFKNELLGRITRLTFTDIPTIEQVVRRVLNDRVVKAFVADLQAMKFEVELADEAVLKLAEASQNLSFGMRILPTVIAGLKEYVVFECQKGKVVITADMIQSILDS